MKLNKKWPKLEKFVTQCQNCGKDIIYSEFQPCPRYCFDCKISRKEQKANKDIEEFENRKKMRNY